MLFIGYMKLCLYTELSVKLPVTPTQKKKTRIHQDLTSVLKAITV